MPTRYGPSGSLALLARRAALAIRLENLLRGRLAREHSETGLSGRSEPRAIARSVQVVSDGVRINLGAGTRADFCL